MKKYIDSFVCIAILILLIFLLYNEKNSNIYKDRQKKIDSMFNIFINDIDSIKNKKTVIYKNIKYIKYKIDKNDEKIKNINIIYDTDSLLKSINSSSN